MSLKEQNELISEKITLEEFGDKLSHLTETHDKIRFAVTQMKCALSQDGRPSFPFFWEVRKRCLELFKENLHPNLRSELWKEYIELSEQAKQLRDLLDEQNSFAVEQIELALQSIENDLSILDEKIKGVDSFDFSKQSRFFDSKKQHYIDLYKKLHILNSFATQIQALRKETGKISLRLSHKYRLFERLSKIGDQVFPQRKKAIEELSNRFCKDIADFFKLYFEPEVTDKKPLYALRQEIKGLQVISKELTLNTGSFTKTRLQLSECWDKVKEEDKKQKSKLTEKKELFEKNKQYLLDQIDNFTKSNAASNYEQAKEAMSKVSGQLRTTEMGKPEIDEVKQSIAAVLNPFREKEKVRKEEKEKQKDRVKENHAKQIETLFEKCEQLTKQLSSLDCDELQQSVTLIKKEQETLTLSFAQEIDLNKRISRLKIDHLQSLENKIDSKCYESHKNLYKMQKNARKQLKEQYENYRRDLSASGLDFEKALELRQVVDHTKEKLDQFDQSIEQVEEKLRSLKGS